MPRPGPRPSPFERMRPRSPQDAAVTQEFRARERAKHKETSGTESVWPLPEGIQAEKKKPAGKNTRSTETREAKGPAQVALDLKFYIWDLKQDTASRSSADAAEAEEYFGQDWELVSSLIPLLAKDPQNDVYLKTLHDLQKKYKKIG